MVPRQYTESMYKIGLDSAGLHRWFGNRLALAVPEPRDRLKKRYFLFFFLGPF